MEEFHCWADCGAHFRSYEFLWNLSEQCEKRFKRVRLHYFAEHHGKGRCDGTFGLQRHWVADFARTSTINSLQGMKEALISGAAATMALGPPPDGPSYHIKVFEPAPKESIKKFDVSGTELQIEYTYCIGLERGVGSKVVARNYIFSDRCTKASSSITIGYAKCVVQKSTEGWRLSYRATAPEKSPLNVTLLQRRLAKQKEFAQLAGVQRRSRSLSHSLAA